MNIFRKLIRKKVPQTKSTHSSGGLRLEALESRLLLNADWSGTWTLIGYEMEGTVNAYGEPDALYYPMFHSITLTEDLGYPGYYTAEVLGDPEPLDFEVQGDRLHYEETEFDGGWIDKTQMEVIPVTPNVSLLMGAEGEYYFGDQVQLVEAWGWFGLMTRTGTVITPTQRPWEGGYERTEYQLEVANNYGGGGSGIELFIEDEFVRVESLGGGQFNAEDYYDPDPQEMVTLNSLGNYLKLVDEGVEYDDYLLQDVAWEEQEWIYRTTDDLIVSFGGYMEYATVDEMLLEAGSWVSIFEPMAGYEYKTDLVGLIDATSLPASVLPGDYVTVPLTLGNIGNATALGSIDVDLYASTDTTLDAGDTYLDTFTPYVYLPVDGSSSQNLRIQLPNDLPYDNYYLLADIDPMNKIAELFDEGQDNIAAAELPIEVAEPRIDLNGSIDLRGWSTAMGGDRGLITLSIANDGNISVNASIDIDLYLSTDQVLDAADTLITDYADQSVFLKQGAETSLWKFITLPTGQPTASYYLLADLDVNGDVNESNETNNVSIGGQITIEEAYVDLSAAVDLGTWNPSMGGDRGLVFINVTNEGNTTANGTVDLELYLSTDDQLDGADTLIEEKTSQFVYIPKNSTRPFFSFLTLPTGQPAGDYHLLAKVIPADSLYDKDAGNDIAASESISLQEAFVDLSVDVQLKTWTTALGGDSGLVYINVINEGNVTANGSVDIQLFLCNNEFYTAGDTLIKEMTNQRIYLPKNSTRPFFSYITLPTGKPTDDYHIIAQVTPDPEFNDENTTNDTGASSPITITKTEVDLFGDFGLNTFQSQISAGQLGVLLMNVRNQGNVKGSGTMDMDLWASPDGDLGDGNDYLLSTWSDQMVYAYPNSVQPVIKLVTWPIATVPAGDYYLIARLDAADEITEPDETNNLIVTTNTYTVI